MLRDPSFFHSLTQTRKHANLKLLGSLYFSDYLVKYNSTIQNDEEKVWKLHVSVEFVAGYTSM